MPSSEIGALKIKPGDFFLLAFFLTLSILSFFLIYNSYYSTPGIVQIHHSGTLISELPLDPPDNYTIMYNGAEVRVRVSNERKVSVIYSNCPLKLCVKHKEISKNGESIVCLPNKIIISIKKNKNKHDIDTKTY
ncbi:MAG TPA: NusG domain II-containing protein [Firmicutes bacterium]|mgnify:CR=1 FL=1|nr:NusG domain II-containing protein [Bacillota bacterium]